MSLWKKCNNAKSIRKLPLWTVGVAVGVFFLTIGFLGDQFADMYRKAVMICLECIGIG